MGGDILIASKKTDTLYCEHGKPYGVNLLVSHFLKNSVCKHNLGMLIRLKLISVPLVAKTVPLGQLRKRGRPRKAKKALLTQ